MTCAEAIVRALISVGKSAYTSGLSKRIHLRITSRKKLVNVALMSNVKNNVIRGGVEHTVYCHSKLNSSEI